MGLLGAFYAVTWPHFSTPPIQGLKDRLKAGSEFYDSPNKGVIEVLEPQEGRQKRAVTEDEIINLCNELVVAESGTTSTIHRNTMKMRRAFDLEAGIRHEEKILGR